MSTTDTPTAAFTVVQGLVPGLRVRVTWPNGFARTGLIGRLRLDGDEYLATHDGVIVTGGYNAAATVEVMGSNGRYTPCWTAPPRN